MDGCYGPMYPTAGDSNMAYKDMCFVPTELPQSTSPGTATPVTSIGKNSHGALTHPGQLVITRQMFSNYKIYRVTHSIGFSH